MFTFAGWSFSNVEPSLTSSLTGLPVERVRWNFVSGKKMIRRIRLKVDKPVASQKKLRQPYLNFIVSDNSYN
jgi:hypothetical protein